jgi:predicted secreted hydrolase
MPTLSVPADDAVHKGDILQWWYWSGQLEAQTGRRFGFQVVFFAAEVLQNRIWGQMAQAAVSDIDAKVFRNEEVIWTGQPEVVPNAFTLSTPRGEVAASGGDGKDVLRASLAGYSLELRVTAQRPATLQYDGTLHRYGFGGNTYYYSRELIEAEGLVTTERGEALAVKGSVWFDRQFGELIPAILVGWQWFGMQLDDGSQILVYDFNRSPEEFYGRITYRDGTTRELSRRDCEVTVLDMWRSPRSRINYPHRWRLNILGRNYTITPLLDDQEMDARFWIGPRYWEGACRVEGDGQGRAYVELTGFSR